MLCRYTGPAIASRSKVLNANGAIIMHASALPQQMGTGRPPFAILWLQGQGDPLYVRVPSPGVMLVSCGIKAPAAAAGACAASHRMLLCSVLDAAVLSVEAALTEAVCPHRN